MDNFEDKTNNKNLQQNNSMYSGNYDGTSTMDNTIWNQSINSQQFVKTTSQDPYYNANSNANTINSNAYANVTNSNANATNTNSNANITNNTSLSGNYSNVGTTNNMAYIDSNNKNISNMNNISVNNQKEPINENIGNIGLNNDSIPSQTGNVRISNMPKSEQTNNIGGVKAFYTPNMKFDSDNKSGKKNIKSGNNKKNNNNKKDGNFISYAKRGVAIAAAAAIFGGVAGGTFNIVTNDKINKTLNSSEVVAKVDSAITTENSFKLGDNSNEDKDNIAINTTNSTVGNKGTMDVSAVAESFMPSVVAITTKGIAEANQGFFGTYQYETEGSGSGIIIGKNDKELLILTNNHVVDGANTVSVAFVDEKVNQAKVKGTNSNSDLAVIVVDLDEIDSSTLEKIKVAKIGDSDKVQVGEQVVAIGNALGYGQSVTTGIVSAKDRTNDTNDTPLIQTDAAINPGNSGGALVNMNGELIGINSSKYASYDVEGMGYAISITAAQDIINELSNRKTRDKVEEDERGYLGISCETVTEAISQTQGIPMGVFVSEVQKGSAAEKAGIKKYNIITKFDGQVVSSADQLVKLLEGYKAGETVKVNLSYLEDDEYVEKEITVTLGKK